MAYTTPIAKHLGAIFKNAMNFFMYGDEDSLKCEHCKGALQLKMKNLYLLPCRFDASHEETVAYYKNHAALIVSANQIPTGQRSAFMSLFQCSVCGNKRVSVIDFLKVRNNTVVKGGNSFSYEEMGEFVENDYFEAKKMLPPMYEPENSAYSYIDRDFN